MLSLVEPGRWLVVLIFAMRTLRLRVLCRGLGLAGTAGSSYSRERRFFLSSTPTSIQPGCDAWCQAMDLCDKARSGSVSTDATFTQCLDDSNRELVPASTNTQF